MRLVLVLALISPAFAFADLGDQNKPPTPTPTELKILAALDRIDKHLAEAKAKVAELDTRLTAVEQRIADKKPSPGVTVQTLPTGVPTTAPGVVVSNGTSLGSVPTMPLTYTYVVTQPVGRAGGTRRRGFGGEGGGGYGLCALLKEYLGCGGGGVDPTPEAPRFAYYTVPARSYSASR